MAKKESDKKPVIAYVPFKTFLTAIELLGHGVPTRIDRTVWPSYSGAIRGQLLAAFRFLGLTDEGGTPTPDLHKLVEDKVDRKAILRKLLERSYPDLIALDLTKASAGTLDAAIRKHGFTGATHGKVTSFFLQAAKFSELPLSSYILKQTRSAPTSRRRRGARSKPPAGEAPVPEEAPAIGGPIKTLTLEGGATLSLSASADTFNWAAGDRRFVNELLEKLEEYETKGTSARPEKKQRRGRRQSGGEL